VKSTELAMASPAANFSPNAFVGSNGMGDEFTFHDYGGTAPEPVVTF
jgi:hypothetical protein